MNQLQSNNIYLFNIRTREHEKLEVQPLLEKATMENVKEEYSKIGLKVEISIIEYPERLVRKYFEYKGYTVLKCNPLSNRNGQFLETSEDAKKDVEIIIKYLEDNYKFYDKEDYMNLTTYLNRAGIPDFLVYRKEHQEVIHDLFFVEVKSWDDGLKGHQLLWIFQNNVPTKLAYIT